jgi:hypothetical protein
MVSRIPTTDNTAQANTVFSSVSNCRYMKLCGFAVSELAHAPKQLADLRMKKNGQEDPHH